MLRLSLLGVLRLEVDGVEVAAPSSRRARLLLALLALERRSHSREALAARLWPGVLDESARVSLRTALVQLRAALGPSAGRFLHATREHVALAGPQEVWTDVAELERLLGEGQVQGALELWGGELLTGLEEDWVLERRDELRHRLCVTVGVAAGEAEARGDLQGALALTRRLVGLDWLAEEGQRELIRRLARAGDRAGALAVYERFSVRLREQLGTVPSVVTRELAAAVRAGTVAGGGGTENDRSDAGGAATAAAAGEAAGALPSGVVTFLLTDVEGSTRLWEADADAMAAALEFLERLIARLVQHHGGRLLKDKGEGDSTLSVFARASDAVACAAELQRALTKSSAEGPDLRLRVALHSGEAQERDGDYFGVVLNRAARLRSLASGGATVLSQGTAELVRDRLGPQLALVELGRRELRGLSRPERVFELRPSAAAPADGRGLSAGAIALALPQALQSSLAAFESPFVGRQAQVERLRERWTRTGRGERSAVLVGGEAGIGKTRLAAEFAWVVHGEGALVLYGRCDEGLAVPYQPFVEGLRPYARAVGLDRLHAELGDLAPQLGRLLPELAALGDPVRGDPQSERFALFEAVAALFEAMTREQRVLFVLDDLHWAASPTLLLVRHLIRSERPHGALLLGTYRETEPDLGEALAQLLADLQRDAATERLSIRGLDEGAIAALLEATVGHAPDDRAQLAQALQAQTAGNPFFIRELLAHLAESRERSSTRLTAAGLEVPEGLRHVIAQRVARLSAATADALRVAAVAGPTFSFVLLERVLGDAGVLDALDEAVAAGLLTETEHGEYAFAHALVRQTIYGDLSSARRMRLHRRLGEALEALGEGEAYVESLAHHFAHAAADGQGVKAAAYALAAGRRATARLGYEEAADHYERGLQALTPTPQPHQQRRCELLLALGEARWGAGELDKARRAYEQAAELAEALGDSTTLARAALGFSGPHRIELAAPVTRRIADLLQRALDALGEDDSVLRAQLLGRLAAALAYAAVEKRKPLLARQALRIARRMADKATLADVLASTLRGNRGPDNVHECLDLANELKAVAGEVADYRLQALAHAWLLDFLLELTDIEAVERELEALQQLTNTRPERYFTWLLTTVRANRAHLAGNLEDCETLARDALAHRFEGHDDVAAHIFGAQMLFVRREQGRLDELLQTVEQFAHGHPQLTSWRCVLAAIYAQLERAAQARHELAALAHADFEDLPRDGFWLPSLAELSEVVVFLDDPGRAQQLYTLLLPYADHCVVAFALLSRGSASRLLGVLATTLSRYDDAQRHFEHALTVNARIRSPLWTAHTQHGYARMLLTRNHPGDRDSALQLLDDALATADRLGLNALAETARALRGSAAASAPPAALPRLA